MSYHVYITFNISVCVLMVKRRNVKFVVILKITVTGEIFTG